MLFQRQMHHSLVARFVICVCLVGFAAAKCVPEKCGSMNVGYPFWINNPNCSYPILYWDYSIACRMDKDTGKLALFLKGFGGSVNGTFTDPHYYKIMKIDYGKGQLVIDSSSIKAKSCIKRTIAARKFFGLAIESPFSLSNSNSLVVLGCNTVGTYSYWELGGNSRWGKSFGEARCVSLCEHESDKPSKSHPSYCPNGCCELNLPDNWYKINFTVGFLIPTNEGNKCASSILMDPSIMEEKNKYGLVVNWVVGFKNCSEAKGTIYDSCSIHAKCFDSPAGYGHICKCLPGYAGDGYSNGTDCKDINECKSASLNKCVGKERGGRCHNVASSYNCSCAKGYVGDGFTNGTGCMSTNSNHVVFPIIMGSFSLLVVVCSIASFLVWWLKKRHLKLLEAKYYQLLQQHIVFTVGRECLRIFSAKEMERSCNNYSQEMVLGTGGFGTVFKGILLDGTLVAIKKSKQALTLEDDHEFLNEVAILSQINHRNIVKLLGCCIQTKFPMLVSEFVPNGTLFEHLHSKDESLSWASRLQIAIETGEALAYLHSGASQPIFHRDVKSSNILLNERLSPKVADFGISRLISTSNNTHVTTTIMGTTGYLDPEYFQSYQLTEKSDVYSFGVVLVELLTSLKPICVERGGEEMSLSSLFLSRLNKNRLIEILDSNVFGEQTLREMEDMARIARECLHLERRKRPSMKEVVEELAWIRSGTRKTKFHDGLKSMDSIFEDRSFSKRDSHTSHEFRSYTFPSFERASEEAFIELAQMSPLLNN